MVRVSDSLDARPGAGTVRLRLRHLCVGRRRRLLIRDLSWDHDPGTVAWVVGENGAGKSSLLRVLAGRMKPRSGRVERRAPHRPPGVVYYHPGMRLPEGPTVADWRRLAARLLARGPTHALPPGLAPSDLHAGQRVDRLSTGQARRLILSTLLRRPCPFVFLDEPYGHLSHTARRALTTALVERARRDVVVVATHQQPPVEAAPGPHLVLDGQRVVAQPHAGGRHAP